MKKIKKKKEYPWWLFVASYVLIVGIAAVAFAECILRQYW